MVDAPTAGTAHLGHGRDPAKDAAYHHHFNGDLEGDQVHHLCEAQVRSATRRAARVPNGAQLQHRHNGSKDDTAACEPGAVSFLWDLLEPEEGLQCDDLGLMPQDPEGRRGRGEDTEAHQQVFAGERDGV